MANGDRPRLFLSSTESDLGEFRAIVIHVCQRLGIDVIAMEDFGADPRTAAEVCQAKIADADLFLGLYAHRYGFAPPGFDGLSMIELEYRWATEREPKPQLLIFLVDEDEKWLPKFIDHGDEWDRLQRFKTQLRLRHVTGELTTPVRLRSDLFEHLPRFRGTGGSPVALPGPTLPKPPDLYVAHQYNLLHTASVIGREAELAQLDEWANNAAGPRVLSIVGIGGLGKSALSWRWFHDNAAGRIEPLAGRMWWSFYAPEADFDEFVSVTLAYCSEQPLETVRKHPAARRDRSLLDTLDRKRFLLVLDGIEHLLGPVADPSSARLPDADIDRLTSSEPAARRPRLRETADRRAGDFIRRLAGLDRTRTLLTTRRQPAALQTEGGDDLPGSAPWPMPRMEFDDASALWEAMGCTGSRELMADLFEQIDYYPLLIRVLAGIVRNFRPSPGHLDSWARENPGFRFFGLPLIQSKTHVLANTLNELAERTKLLLSCVSLFRSAVSYTILEELFVRQLGWSSAALDAELRSLEDSGILGWDRKANTYEVHAVVRGVVWADIESAPERSGEQSASAPQAYRALIPLLQREAEYRTAARLFTSQLGGGSAALTELGEVDTEIALLEGMFPDGIEADPAVDEEHVQGFIAWLGHAYEAAGRLPEAVRCAERCVHRIGAGQGVPIFLSRYLAERLRIMGRLRESLEVAMRAGPNGDEAQRLLCLATIGESDQVREALARRQMSTTSLQRPDIRTNLLLGYHERAIDLGRQLLKGQDLWVLDRLTTAVDIVEARLLTGDDAGVEAELIKIQTEARDKRLAEPELQCLRVLAERYRLREDVDRSLAALEQIRRHPASRHYRLISADAANTRARLPHPRPADREDAARTAFRLARCAEPEFAYRPALEVARTTLRALGIDPPMDVS